MVINKKNLDKAIDITVENIVDHCSCDEKRALELLEYVMYDCMIQSKIINMAIKVNDRGCKIKD